MQIQTGESILSYLVWEKVAFISEMRNKDSDAHDVGASRIDIDEHHIQLFVNVTTAMSDFIPSM